MLCAIFTNSMNYEQFQSLFKKQVTNLSNERQFTLGILISKKLYFDYLKFSTFYDWGDPDILLDAIKLCEKTNTTSVNEIAIKEFLSKVDSITPDMDDFGDELGSYALNACTSVHDLLQYLLNNDLTYILNIGSYFTDTIDLRIQEIETLTSSQINKHPQMIEARNFLLEHSK